MRVRWWLLALVAAVAGPAVVGGADVVSAHTDLEQTEPADGAIVAEPVDEVVLVFDDPVTLAGDAFRVLDPQGRELVPPATSDDGVTHRLAFDPPLAGGAVGVVYEVVAADGHVISGGFSFDVTAAAATTAPTLAPTTAPITAPATTPVTTPTSTAEPDTPTTAPPSIEPPTNAGNDGGDGSTLLVIVAAATAVLLGGAAVALARARAARAG